MSKSTQAIVIIVLLALVVAGVWWAKGFIARDSCLDRGGRWNSATASCEGASP